MSKVKKNIRLCAISTDFSELGGYNVQFCRRVFEKMVEHTARTGEWTTWAKVMTSRLYILAPFEKATFTVRSRAGNPEGQPQKKEISATVKYADLVFERVKSNVVLVGGG